MTVIEFMEQKGNSKTFGKRVRVLESADNSFLGGVIENADRHICRVKITSKFLFIFVD